MIQRGFRLLAQRIQFGFSSSQVKNGQYYLDNLKGVKLNPQVIAIDNPSETQKKQFIGIIRDSFGGVEGIGGEEITLNWMVGKELASYSNPLRVAIFQYLGNMIFYLGKKFGVLYAVQDQNTKEIQGAMVCIKPENIKNGHFDTLPRTLGIVMNCGLPPYMFSSKYSKDIAKKENLIKTKLKEFHGEYGKNPHWYLLSIGVSPKHQGKGVGKKLLNLLNDISDQQNLQCYLEASGDKNRGIYERFGYKIVKEFTPEVNGPSPEATGMVMIRPRKQ